MCCTCSIICWSNLKRFFECFNCFWKVFLFGKISKNFKNCATQFWRLCLAGQASRAPPIASWLNLIRDSLASQGPSREKDLENFQKSGFLAFSWLSLATCLQVEAPVASFTQIGLRLPLWLIRGWTFQLRKTLKNLSHGCLATCSRLNLVAKISCFTLWELLSGQF